MYIYVYKLYANTYKTRFKWCEWWVIKKSIWYFSIQFCRHGKEIQLLFNYFFNIFHHSGIIPQKEKSAFSSGGDFIPL